MLPNASALISAARASARAAAQSGSLDQWSFDGVTLPYLDELAATRDRDIASVRSRAAAARQDIRESQRQIAAEAVRIELNEQQLTMQRDEALSFMRTARSEVNRLARLEAQQQQERSLAMPLQAADGASPEVPLWLEEQPEDVEGRPISDQPVPDPPLDATTVTEAAWTGPEAPRMTRRWTSAILFSLVLVEVPIQYVIFQYFHNYSPIEELLTWVFTIPVSAVMVLLPHLAGWWYRDRTATGADRLMRYAPLALLVPWAYLAVMLGYLRARVLLAPLTVSVNSSTSYLAGPGAHIPSTAGSLHVTPTTMSVMFVALILGVGGIGFMLGLAREHPLIGAFRGARAKWRELGEQLQPLAEPIQLAEARDQARAEEDQLSDERWARHIEAIRATYVAVAHAYLDAIAAAMGDPAVTEAVTRMSQRIDSAEEHGQQVPTG